MRRSTCTAGHAVRLDSDGPGRTYWQHTGSEVCEAQAQACRACGETTPSTVAGATTCLACNGAAGIGALRRP